MDAGRSGKRGESSSLRFSEIVYCSFKLWSSQKPLKTALIKKRRSACQPNKKKRPHCMESLLDHR